MIAKTDALELINELEERSPCVRSLEVVEGEAYEEWMKDVVKSHPALKGLPKEIAERLAVKPKEGHLVGNRSRRRLWKKEGGVILYLYSGANDGYTMARAIQQLGGQKRKVLQVDLKNGEKWDLMRDDLYSEILYGHRWPS